MMPQPKFWRRAAWTAACLAAVTGCSSTKGQLAQTLPQPKSPPWQTQTQAVSVPGTAEAPPTNELKHPAKVHVAYGRWQEQQRQTAGARDSYLQALNHDPKSVEALLGLSRLAQLGGRPDEAEKYLQKAEKLRPNDALIHAAKGEFHAAQRRWAPALTEYRKAVELAPHEPVYQHQLAVALANSGDASAALAEFTRILGPAEAQYNVGHILYQQGRLVEAEEHFQRALAQKPDLKQAATMLARVQRERSATAVAASAPAPSAPAPTRLAAVQPAAPPATAASTPPSDWRQTDEARSTGGVQPAAYSSEPPRPSRLTPQQLEQLRNQSSAGAPAAPSF